MTDVNALRVQKVVSDEHLDLMCEWGTVADIPELVAAIRAQRTELEALRKFAAIMQESGSRDTTTAALYMGAKKMRGYAQKVALLHSAQRVADDIGQLPLPGQTEQGGFGEH